MPKKISEKYNLKVLNNELAKEWHPTKNGKLMPTHLTPKSGKKVWWICKKGHEWEATIYHRSNGTGCPYCSGKRIGDDNNFEFLYPKHAKLWNYKKNNITPKEIAPKSNKKFWWICSKGHEWKTAPNNLTRTENVECDICRGRVASEDSNFQINFPNIAKEWHPTKNEGLSPDKFVSGSHKKVWWKCDRGHEWKTTIYHRAISNTRCPHCSSKVSYFELMIYSEYKALFNKCQLRKKIHGKEIDVFLPKYNIGIEVDGVFWHGDKLTRDKEKNKFLESKGITVINIRQEGLTKINDNSIFYSKKSENAEKIAEINDVLVRLASLTKSDKQKVIKYNKTKSLINESYLKSLWDRLPSPLPGESLYDQFPEIAKEWHPTKNGSLKPQDVYPNSHLKVFWVCLKGHEYESSIGNRGALSQGCPYCSNRKVGPDNNLKYINPEISKEWHFEKNIDLLPEQVIANTTKKVWWLCKDKHEWKSSIRERNVNGVGCPYCANLKVGADNNLQYINPKLAKEWHPTKNGNLIPDNVVGGTPRKVWWLCKNKHEWQARINSRHSRGIGCPYCSGRFATDSNNLLKSNPELSKQWNIIKNGDLKPNQFTPKSDKKVWWVCDKKHEWEATIAKRSNGRGCPYCSHQKVGYGNDLKTRFPEAAKLWNYSKNKGINPDEVLGGGKKTFWWICDNGHEWQKSVELLVRNIYCPDCKKANKNA